MAGVAVSVVKPDHLSGTFTSSSPSMPGCVSRIDEKLNLSSGSGSTMPKSPHFAPFDAEEQRFFSEPLPNI